MQLIPIFVERPFLRFAKTFYIDAVPANGGPVLSKLRIREQGGNLSDSMEANLCWRKQLRDWRHEATRKQDKLISSVEVDRGCSSSSAPFEALIADLASRRPKSVLTGR
ncbi:hypothetical protein ABD76_02120 [Paenibacillus dendritiformis]|nr:hypothetical protein [Paenibacillus dendritiformis]